MIYDNEDYSGWTEYVRQCVGKKKKEGHEGEDG
jgi:hypothetical protein